MAGVELQSFPSLASASQLDGRGPLPALEIRNIPLHVNNSELLNPYRWEGELINKSLRFNNVGPLGCRAKISLHPLSHFDCVLCVQGRHLPGGFMRRSLRTLVWFGIAAGANPAVNAAQFLIVTHPSGSGWLFQSVDSISVNGKEKLRSAPLPTASIDPKSIGKLAEVQLASITVLRRAADGVMIARGADGNWQALVPENTNSKTPEPDAQLWSRSTVAYKADHKDKSATAVRMEDLYAIVPSRDPAVTAAWLATDIAAHKIPGISDGDAFRQMLALLPDAAKAFPDETATKTINDFLKASLQEHLDRWSNGDAPQLTLDESVMLATASGSTFPQDKALADLSARVHTIRQALDRKLAILRALDAGKQSDAFLIAYRDFEVYDKSFPELAKARDAHMRLSAAAHVRTAQLLQANGDYMGAIRHLLIAKWRDPSFKVTDDLLEGVRLEAARLSVQKFAETRRGIDPRSPAQVQLQRRLLLAEQQMNDGKIPEAEKTLQQAEAMDKNEPRLTLLQARLSVARGEYGRALAQLDSFDGIAVTPEDFTEGEKLRASVQYTIENSLTKKRSQIESDLDGQRFASALESSAEGLKLDNENPDFLYFAGVNACIMRHCGTAEPTLRRFLEVTDSTQGNRERRLMAMQLLRESLALATADSKTAKEGAETSWFSGAPVGRGEFYDPTSMAFQSKPTRIEASDHLTVSYEWNENQLRSVHAKHEEKQTGGNVARLAGAAAASAAGMSSTLNWKTAGRETNDFYFNYYDDTAQVLKVSREKTVVESRRIPISIPGVGIFGPLAGVGALNAIGSLSAISYISKLGALTKGISPVGGVSSLGGISPLGSLGSAGGIAGAQNMAILSRLAGSGRMSGITGFTSLGASQRLAPAQNYSVLSDPMGGSTEGYLTLWNSPRIDPKIAFKVTGKRAAVGFSGNKYFYPFAWDGIHLFEMDYDDEGRVMHAWELDSPGSPRLDFTWDGRRLMRMTACDDLGNVVYSRTLNYSGDKLTRETITGQGGSSHIDYKYDKQGRMTEAVADADHTLDGRSRKVYFEEGRR